MGQKKGQTGNPNGRPPGSQNKTAKEAREMILSICHGHLEKVNKTLSKLEGKDFIDAVARLLGLVIPKQAEIGGNAPLVFKVIWDERNGNSRGNKAEETSSEAE